MDQLKNTPLFPSVRIVVDVHLSSNSPLHLAQRDSSPRASVSIEKATSTCTYMQQMCHAVASGSHEQGAAELVQQNVPPAAGTAYRCRG